MIMEWNINRGNGSERKMLWLRTLAFLEQHHPEIAIEAIKEGKKASSALRKEGQQPQREEK